MKTDFAPSVYQEQIFNWIKDPGRHSRHAVVQAVAGSGKTTTILKALEFMKGSVIFCAFNKHIADELRTHAPRHVTTSTIHSVGLSAIGRSCGRPRVNGKKVRELIRRVAHSISPTNFSLIRSVDKLVRMAKLTLTSPNDIKGLLELVDRYDIDIPSENLDNALKVLKKVLIADLKNTSEVDFEDMLWIPIVNNLQLKTYDWVCVDEAQDLSAAQRELVLRMAQRESGRVIAVGDHRQAIYGFAGADTRSIPLLSARLRATELPLSICYRCPTTHIALAREIAPQIQARPDAPAGIVGEMKVEEVVKMATDGDMVLCRTNAPLVRIALELIKGGQKAIIRGRDIASNLRELVEKMYQNCDRGTLNSMLDALDDYREREMAKLYEKDKIAQAHSLEDRCDTIAALAEGVKSTQELIRMIGEIFSDENAGVVCSTIHKAKGLEADRVFIYRPDLLPFPFAKKVWELEQEMNLKYVALTRARDALYFVEKGDDF